ncbi:protoporphyrinogen oxidase [Acrocarpospora catenulata]|uniref:protoporphyrinogen oxidase n=1 Tax=Acrocarpospora catenulata TaxID=2836182 RepID=UPI001BD98188|nr:protoporphyrinogen oxidase [Acrocarpospora catenulata]
MEKDRHVVVVGAGVAGLAAAWFLRQAGGDRLRITVLDGASRIGGKLHASEVAGVRIDAGAESMLARRPEGLELVRGLGLDEELADPATTRAAVLSRGALRPMPGGQVLGIPGDLTALAKSGVLSPGGLARVPMDQVLPPTLVHEDVSVAAYVRARMGEEVVDRLVEPLLGGVYAGRADRLSLTATMPAVAAAARTEGSLLKVARDLVAATPKNAGPVFTTLRDGMGSLPAAIAEASGARVRTGVMVRELSRTATGWRLVTGPTRDAAVVQADAVVLAVPGPAAAKLLGKEVPAAARELAAVEYASMAIVTLAYPREAVPGLPEGSGYLVPPVEGRPVKAVTFSSSKWPHLAEHGLLLARCSLGRIGEEYVLQREDADLVELGVAELAEVAGVRGRPIDTRVTRWGGGLPQYNVGHTERVARIRAAVAGQPGLAVCGAAYDGLGIPACVGSAKSAASRILDHLDPERKWSHDDQPATQGA